MALLRMDGGFPEIESVGDAVLRGSWFGWAVEMVGYEYSVVLDEGMVEEALFTIDFTTLVFLNIYMRTNSELKDSKLVRNHLQILPE